MLETAIVLLVVVLIIAGILISPRLTQSRRDRLQQRPLPPLWSAIIENYVPVYSRLAPAERRQLQGHIHVFLAEKQFIGCGGVQVTEEMKVAIAAIASLLVLNGRNRYFPKLHSVLIYPTAYFVNETSSASEYVVEEQRVARLGESWTRDQLVLSWAQIKHDAKHWQDGRNVVLHEFAHQLDQEDGRAEGVPILPSSADYATWATVMTQEYQQLCHDVEQGKSTVMDSYGATHPAEFFAVATETFFEKPRSLLNYHPALYHQLKRYYQLDPIQWES